MRTYNGQTVLGCGWDCKAGAWALHGHSFNVVATFPSKEAAHVAFYGSEEAVAEADRESYLDERWERGMERA